MSVRDLSVGSRISVLIAEARPDILGPLLEKAVSDHARMTLLDRVRIPQANAILEKQRGRCVLLLLGHGKSPVSTANRFLNRYPDLAVIAIDVAKAGIAIRLRQIGLDQLLETICTLSSPDARNRRIIG
jgi:hypothetical protein